MGNRGHRKIPYFGYGANASVEMIKAIIGRKPIGCVARVNGYELWIQSWRQIPSVIRRTLKKYWKSDFKTYCISPQRGETVRGHIWFLTSQERKLVSEWEFWYQPIEVVAKVQNGRSIVVETEMIKKPVSRIRRINAEHYKFFLNDKKRMLEVARRDQARTRTTNYLATQEL